MTACEIRVGLSALGVASALAALLIVETWRLKEVARRVLSEMLKARAYNRIHDKGHAAGRSEGRGEGAEFVQQQWAAWNRGRMEHETRGDSFTAPRRLKCLPGTCDGQHFRGPADMAVANTCSPPPGRLRAIRPAGTGVRMVQRAIEFATSPAVHVRSTWTSESA